MFEDAVHIAEKRREVNGKEKIKINPSECRFQRTAWRDKKVFLSDQYKEIGENNRMGKNQRSLQEN